jgi:hypothetical protein
MITRNNRPPTHDDPPLPDFLWFHMSSDQNYYPIAIYYHNGITWIEYLHRFHARYVPDYKKIYKDQSEKIIALRIKVEVE